MARRGERPPIGLTWIVTWPVSAVFAVLVFLAAEELRHPTRDAGAPMPAPVVAGGPDWSATFPGRADAVNAALQRAALQLPAPIEEARGSGALRWTHRLYEIDLPHADQGRAEAAIETLRGVDPGLAITAENTVEGTDVKVGLDGLLVSTLRFRWADAVTPKPLQPRLALVIGALGDDLRLARRAVEIDGPLAIAVRPFRPFSAQVAELGRLFDRPVLVQLEGSPEGSEDAGSAAAQLSAALASVPKAVGVAWVPPAGTPPDPQLLAAVAQRQLAFIGERAAVPAGRAAPVVAEVGADSPEAMAAALGAAVEKARSPGGAIAFAPASEVSLAAIDAALPGWREGEIELVPVMTLAAPTALSAR